MIEQLPLAAGYEGHIWLHKNWPGMQFAHSHEELELNLVIQGTAAYLLGRHRVDLAPNTIFWIFPEPEHILVDKSPDFEMWIVVFRPTLLRQVCSEPAVQILMESASAQPLCRRLPQPLLRRLASLCQDLLQAHEESARFNLGLGYLLLSAWSAYQKANEAVLITGIHPAVARSVQLLLDQVEQEALPELAQRVGLSTSRLSRLFQQQTGLSLVEFRNHVRVRRFVKLLETQPHTTLLDLALQSGFGSYAQFHRIFKQIMGVSPRSLRREELGQAQT